MPAMSEYRTRPDTAGQPALKDRRLARGKPHAVAPGMRPLAILVIVVIGACLDTPSPHGAAVAELVTTWDPLICGDPHRVEVELTDLAGATSAASAPCELGVVALDVSHLGNYTGRVYAWAVGEPARSITPITVAINEPVAHQQIATPE